MGGSARERSLRPARVGALYEHMCAGDSQERLAERAILHRALCPAASALEKVTHRRGLSLAVAAPFKLALVPHTVRGS